jgi:hypothetical protein
MIIGLVLCCASGGWAQSSGTSDQTYGVVYPSVLNPPISPGAGPSISSVDSSVSNAGLGGASAASPSTTSMNERVSAAPVGSLSGSGAGGRSSALGGMASSFSESKSAWAGAARAGASGFLTSGFSASAGRGPKSQLPAGSSLPTLGLANRTARLSSPAGQALLFQLEAMGEPGQNTSAAAVSDQRQALSALPGKVATAIGGGQYTTDFPDSTKNTGMVSPPDLGNVSPFVFSTEIASGFPDLSQREFLRPTYRVGLESSRAQQTEDLYERIERRLKEYQEAANNGKTAKNGLKADHAGSSGLKNPYEKRSLGDRSRSLGEGSRSLGEEHRGSSLVP